MKIIEYPISHASLDYIELNHLLKLTGFADSGGSGGALVTTGVVKVDGQIELRKRNKIRVGQVVRIGDTEIHIVANPDGDAAPELKPPKSLKVATVTKAPAGGKPAGKGVATSVVKGVAQRRRPRGVAPRGGAASGKPSTGAKPAKPRTSSK